MIENEREKKFNSKYMQKLFFVLKVNKKRFKKVLLKSTQGNVCNFKNILTTIDLKKDENFSILGKVSQN